MGRREAWSCDAAEHRAVRWYRLLLVAFPPDFRAVYAPDLLDTFRDQWRVRASGRTLRIRAGFWLRIATDALLQGLTERGERLVGRSRPSAPRRPLRALDPVTWATAVEAVGSELRLAFRSLRRRPVFAATAVAVLSLSLAAASTIWATAYHVVLAPLGYADEDRLVQIWHKVQRGPELEERFGMSDALLLALEEETRTLEALAWIDIVAPQNGGVFEPVGGPPARIPYTRVSTSFFGLLGVRPILGRLFVDADEGLARIVLSHRAWLRLFAGDPGVIGRAVRFRDEIHEVIGILPPDFAWPEFRGQQPDFWTPVRLDPDRLNIFYYHAVARARPDTDLDAIELDTHRVLQPVARPAFDESYWGDGPERWVTVAPLRDGQLGDVGPRMRALAGATAVLVLLGVVNLSLLLLVRVATRTRETAVRAALGGGARGVLAPTVSEVVVLTGMAGLVATGLSWAALSVIRSAGPADLPRLDQVGMSIPVLAGTTATVVAVGLAVAVAPVVALRAVGMRAVLQSLAQSAGGGALPRALRVPLLVAGGALAVALTCGATLTARSLVALERVDLGFQAEGVLQGRIRLPVDRFWSPVEGSPGHYLVGGEMAAFHRELRERLADHPAVTDVALAMHTPLGPRYGGFTPFVREGEGGEEMPPGEPWVAANAVDPGFLGLLGAELVAGRWLSWQDAADAPPVAVVSEPLVRRFWPGQDPLGQRFRGARLAPDGSGGFRWEDVWVTVVGVVRPLREWHVRTANETVYTTLAQEHPTGAYVNGRRTPLSLFVRFRGAEDQVAAHLRTTVAGLLPGTPVDGLETMTELAGNMLREPRFLTGLFVGYAIVALLLASGGVAAVVGFGVSGRTREIGLRMALGAWTRDVVRLLAAETIVFTVIGVMVGLALSMVGGRVLEAILFETAPTDPLSMLVASGVFVVIAAAAAWVPARRALSIDPAQVLRHE
ncbi:MAG TPA: ABC transporter permease [Longimicrobiales bacterium]|nr:ABC transporter permease [Longimicrobiales bacterium]